MGKEWLLKIVPSGRGRTEYIYDEFHAGKIIFQDILVEHRWNCKIYRERMGDLKTPYDKRTGRPWSESTLRTKKGCAGGWKRDVRHLSMLIQQLISEGFGLGNPRAPVKIVPLFPKGRSVPDSEHDSRYGKTTKLLHGYVKMYLDAADEARWLKLELETSKKIIAGYQNKPSAPVFKLVTGRVSTG
ncbi:MAG: hypothetical protein M0036_25910 [Desulfobacteraceae bacterium]|nr:hypothetical protein [Desulfobacteraceae bacterium]